MRKETMNPKTSNWSLGRIPVSPANVKGPSPKCGVTLTEVECGKDHPVSVGTWTGYPYVSLKK